MAAVVVESLAGIRGLVLARTRLAVVAGRCDFVLDLVVGCWNADPRSQRKPLPNQSETFLGSNVVCRRFVSGILSRTRAVLLDMRLASVVVGLGDLGCVGALAALGLVELGVVTLGTSGGILFDRQLL